VKEAQGIDKKRATYLRKRDNPEVAITGEYYRQLTDQYNERIDQAQGKCHQISSFRRFVGIPFEGFFDRHRPRK
jgi:hypothetical protein